MLFNNIDFSNIVLTQYSQSWWLWILLLIIGIIFVKFSDALGTTRRKKNKMLSSGSGLIAISIVVHIAVVWSWL